MKVVIFGHSFGAFSLNCELILLTSFWCIHYWTWLCVY